MNVIQTRKLQCPYCGETIELLLDCSEPNQEYIEDCQVCCRPINIAVVEGVDGDVDVYANHENE